VYRGVYLHGEWSSKDIDLGLVTCFCLLPAFFVGFMEDVTKKAGVFLRMLGIIVSSILAFYLIPVHIDRLDIPQSELILSLPFVMLFLTVFCITGLTNAYNLIDGFNGLASMVAILTLLSISYVGFKNNDVLVTSISLIMIGSIAGFFVWNYPNGLIFLGDCGAYLIGFLIGVLSILIVQRNAAVSPFFALIVNAYPIFETLFTTMSS
jgi:UDP-N-acetylmuramyl pentapeptide phosphotransferase/UDP-N-acetylglucosamine-1-phosphate transferase